MWNPRKPTRQTCLAWHREQGSVSCVRGRSATIRNTLFKGAGGEGGTGEMALSQVLCSLALAAILASKGKMEEWNFLDGCSDFPDLGEIGTKRLFIVLLSKLV